MNILKALRLAMVATSLFFITSLNSQTKYHTKDDISVTISGTSTLHSWEMKSTKGEVNATFTFDSKGQISGLTQLTFTTPAEGLKSDHSGMDKNAYKALKSSTNPTITFTSTSSTVTVIDASTVTIKSTGKLTLAGVTNDVTIITTCKLNVDKSISVVGSRKMAMSDFKIDPPSFMMGAVKTGNDIIINFSLTLKK